MQIAVTEFGMAKIPEVIMGCDIHLFTEYRDQEGKWNPADIWVRDNKWGELKWRVPSHVKPYDDRNYNFFAWLADVRNGTWGEAIPPISAPRGLPEDCSDRIREQSDSWDGDGHSHSYFTMAELEEAFKETEGQFTWFAGAIDPRNPSPELAKWIATPEDKRGEPPGGYCAAGTHCVPFRWKQTIRELIERPYSKLTNYLWNVGWEYSVQDKDENVRIVFWFDN